MSETYCYFPTEISVYEKLDECNVTLTCVMDTEKFIEK